MVADDLFLLDTAARVVLISGSSWKFVGVSRRLPIEGQRDLQSANV
jgi:hypothetical protein